MKTYNKTRNILKFGSRNLVSTLAIVMFLSISSSAFSQEPSETDNSFETVKNLDIFYTLYKEVNLYYVDQITPGDIIKTGIDGMLKSLDPYTVYIPESKVEDLRFMTTGQYGGIGSVIRREGKYTVIVQPYTDSPAEKAGLISGDVILEIDGRSIEGIESTQVSELLRGEPKTTLELKVDRIGQEDHVEVKITREEIKRNSVPYYGLIEENIGYIALNSFTNTAGSEVEAALVSLKKDHNIDALVLDLRGNPGGLLIESVKICNLFVDKGESIVSTKGKVAQWDKEYIAFTNPVDKEIKVVVLVNSSSASASEIVSGCIQDLDRGVIVGQRTFGKGLVQTTRELSYNGILKVTTAKYYIPSGRCIQALDYSNRNDDGSVGHVPDSLITKFETKNGREVFDGGGVNPDVEVGVEYLSKITSSLIIKSLIFDYANFFKFNNAKIASADKFKFTDENYNDFVVFLKDKDFDYKTKTEQDLNDLIETSKKEKYYDEASEELDALTAIFAHDKDKDLMLFKDEIIDIISQEIILKYYNEQGAIIYGLKNDPEIQKAVDVLKDEALYNSILEPKK